ncbi:MAG: 2-C-methyl-D-erythritol 2,4-cyclodiphosphate synthase [Acidimicrobiia bacterium]
MISGARIGWGVDAHAFGGAGPLVLCGVVVDPGRGLIATSDGDVAAHALADALLGAGALGDLGDHFPSSDPRWLGASSMDIVVQVSSMVADAGFEVINADVTVVAESVRIAPHRDAMRDGLAGALRIPKDRISVKATSTDGLGFTGRDEGIAAFAVAAVQPGE